MPTSNRQSVATLRASGFRSGSDVCLDVDLFSASISDSTSLRISDNLDLSTIPPIASFFEIQPLAVAVPCNFQLLLNPS